MLSLSDKEKLKEYIKKNPNILLDDLAKKIAGAYGVKTEFIASILKEETRNSLESFKDIYKKNEDIKEKSIPTLSEEIVEELYYTLEWARQVFKDISHKDIELFKENLPASITEQKKYLTNKILPQKMMIRAQKPQNISDQITGICIGSANSCEEIILTLYKIGKWLFQSPYHIYLIISWQGEYPNWKNV